MELRVEGVSRLGDQLVDEFEEVDLVVDPTERHEGLVSDHDVAAGVDPGSRPSGDVDDVVAIARGDLARPHAAPARLADHVGRPVGSETVEVVGDRGERDQLRPGTWPARYSSGSRTSITRAPCGDTFGEGGHLDLRNRHDAKANAPGRSGD